MTVVRMNLSHIPYLGAFALATEEMAIIPSRFGKIPKKASDALETPIYQTVISQSSLVGILASANSNALLVPDHVDTDEERLAEELDFNVARIPGKYTALGNQILTNDKGAIVNPDLPEDIVKEIEKTLEVPVRKSTVAGLKNVGASGVANNEGALLHPETTEEEMEIVEDALKIEGDIGTASSGVKYVGTCIVTNSKGALTGENTTGPELGRIENALGFI